MHPNEKETMRLFFHNEQDDEDRANHNREKKLGKNILLSLLCTNIVHDKSS